MGQTRDDAAGEAFDKIARALGLGYPGGPKIDKLSKEGDPHAIPFPRVYLEENTYDFSFSGLKSAVLNYINQQKQKNAPIIIEDVAASFQQAVVEVLGNKLINAAKERGVHQVALAGGVACNTGLRAKVKELTEKEGMTLYMPAPIFCTDNAAMIASAGYFEYNKGRTDNLTLNAVPGLRLGQK